MQVGKTNLINVVQVITIISRFVSEDEDVNVSSSDLSRPDSYWKSISEDEDEEVVYKPLSTSSTSSKGKSKISLEGESSGSQKGGSQAMSEGEPSAAPEGESSATSSGESSATPQRGSTLLYDSP